MKKHVVIISLILILSSSITALGILVRHKKTPVNNTPEDIQKIPEEIKKDPILKSVSIGMVGDVLLHDGTYKVAKKGDVYNFDFMFDDVRELFKDKDLLFYNQESIIGGKSLSLSSYPRFNSPEEIGDAMTNMGFNLVSLANNHTLDMNEKGVLNSINYWNTKNVLYSGSNTSYEQRDNIIIKEKNGIKYVMLAYTTTTNGLNPSSGKDYLVNVYNEELVKKQIESIRDKVDLIMVSMHFGVEYMNHYNSDQLGIAKYLSSLGVDIVIGHHPHVIQPVEYVNDTLVVYSLGNFLSGQTGVDKLTGLYLSLDFNIKEEDDIKTKSISNIKADLVYTYYTNDLKNYRIIQYKNLDDKILKDYKTSYQKYKNLLEMSNILKVSEIE